MLGNNLLVVDVLISDLSIGMEKIPELNPNLLIVEPNNDTKYVLEELFSAHMSVTLTSTAKEAISILLKENYSLLLMEIDLPDEDGFHFIKKIKEIDSHLPFVVVTSNPSIKKAIRALEFGAIDYIGKPFSIEDIALLLDKYHSVSLNKKEDYDFISTITEEKRTFCLPSNMQVLNIFIHELMEILKRFGLQQKKIIFSIRLAIYEMLINAFEHGNLEINYQQKKVLLEQDLNYLDFLNERATQEPYKDRNIFVTYHFTRDKIAFTIKDQGKGFEVNKFNDTERARDVTAMHGRGIFITKVNMDHLTYNETGNEVTLVKVIKDLHVNTSQ